MGNSQSAPNVGQHNRLSKPKTNTNSPHVTPKIDSPVSVTSKFADFGVRDRQQFRAQLTSPIATEFDPDTSSNGDDTLGELATHVQRRLSTISRSNSVISNHGSGRNSLSKLASLPGSKLSLVSNPQSVDIDTALKILQEVRKTASPEDLAALHQALQTTVPASSGSPVPDDSLRGRTSTVNRSSSSLTRRRSLIATPGLATRGSSTEGGRRAWNSWKARESEHMEEPKWKVEMMGNSPLMQIAALDLAEEGRESPVPRAQTPGDMDYSHLGSLQLGSLIVTNGAPSPAASGKHVSRRKSAVDMSHGEDYFTSADDNGSPNQKSRGRAHSRSKSNVLPPTPLLHPDHCITRPKANTKASRQSNSPLKQDSQQSHGKSKAEPVKRLQIVTQNADSLAKDYMADIPDSPFGNIPGRHLDEGFHEGPDNVRTSRDEPNRTLEKPISGDAKSKHKIKRKPSAKDRSNYAMLNCMGQEEEEADTADVKPARVASTSSTRESRSEVPTAKQRNGRPAPRKADSGYSSGGSFRTAGRPSIDRETTPTLTKRPSIVVDQPKREEEADGDDNVSLYTFEQMLALTQKPLPPLPSIDAVDGKAVPYKEATFTWHDECKYLMTEEKEVAPSRSSMEPSPISPRTVKSAASNFTNESTSSKRLQKRRPSVQELPVVQSCQPIPEGTIPSIPSPVRAQFVRRLSETPGMECLTRTYLSKDHVNSEEAVVDEPISMDFDIPSQSQTPSKVSQDLMDRPPTPPPHGNRRSLSLFRGKSESSKKQNEVTSPTIVDLGTIAQGLGGSPYDIALPSGPRQRVTSPTHPHQLGNAMPRTKSMVSMDAQTAAEMARMRSKDRAMLRPQMPQRPRSYHEVQHKMPVTRPYEQTYAPDAHRSQRPSTGHRKPIQRPHSLYADVPTVPTHSTPASSRPSFEHTPPPEPAEVVHAVELDATPSIRAKPTGRGPVVTNLIDQYDKNGPSNVQAPDWEAHARLWSQRRKSIGEGLRQKAEGQVQTSHSPRTNVRASTEPPENVVAYGRYSGGLDYGYERGYGVGGSAGTRQLHSAASRKSMHYRHQYGVDLSDVPIIVQRSRS